jgi:tRNA threonylcarbamoyladenosine biosynthesis protein TsaE
MNIITNAVEETRALGARLAASTHAGDLYALEGDLGAGKTEFVRGFVGSFAGAPAVRSPSFSILNIYETSPFPIYHFDFYRIESVSELGEIGFDEYALGEGVCLIEWGTLWKEALPSHAKIIRFRVVGPNSREVELPCIEA